MTITFSLRPLLRRAARRHGVALVLTLAALALLMIMVMSFAFTARLDSHAATNYADSVRARLLSDGALQRAIKLVQRDLTAYVVSGGNYKFNPMSPIDACTDSGWEGRRYLYTMRNTASTFDDSTDRKRVVDSAAAVTFTGWDASTSSDVTFTFTSDDATSGTSLNYPSSNVYITFDTAVAITTDFTGDASVTGDSIVGQYLYLLIDETGKLDPSVCSTSDTNRIGASLSEVNLAPVFAQDSVAGAYPAWIGKFSSQRPAAGWLNWKEILRSPITNLSNLSIASEAYASLFPASQDSEAFYDSATATNFHRFNVGRDLGAAGVTVARLTSNSSLFTGSSTGGISWLASSGTLSGAQRNEIAANIIDYTDANTDNATTDYNSGSPYSASYCGNEQVPLINEVSFIIQHSDAPSPVTSVDCQVELANIYAADVDVDVAVTADYTINGGTAKTNIPHTWGSSLTVSAHSYGITPVSNSAIQNGNAADTVKLVRWCVTVRKNGNIVDVAHCDVTNGSGFTEFSAAYSDPGEQSIDVNTKYQYDFEVHDPRSNTVNSSADLDWVFTWKHDSTSGWMAIDTLGLVNAAWAPTYTSPDYNDNDLESVTDPVDPVAKVGLSTAYIRNGPMQSLWELGAISRAQPYCTIRLAKYNNSDDHIGAYSDGDANILDQVKLTDNTSVTGKFNANSRYELAWKAMLHHVTYGGTYASPASGTALDDNNWSDGNDGYDIVNSPDSLPTKPPGILSRNSCSDNVSQYGCYQWMSRGQLADAQILYYKNTVYTTDRMREEIIGKLANLLSTRMNYYTVIVTGQSLRHLVNRDIGASMQTTYGADRVFPLDDAGDHWVQKLGESRAMVILYRDAFSGQTQIKQVIPLE